MIKSRYFKVTGFSYFVMSLINVKNTLLIEVKLTKKN
ncbi:hypothetical protein FLACHUCJ7_04237 [Flavobacterium chungangense]|uniref:Uncharacterized protein n=2 Tax=Flavobacterium TaxID=237 RepID=A0A6V6ZEU2_9FLAO|nr:hypothetical protein FLAT13_02713 [Flavobacterium salmonis]CAD0009402.1 hypothetical protein FLACHUCJ7_04237 [Flavobacterium chungangense]